MKISKRIAISTALLSCSSIAFADDSNFHVDAVSGYTAALAYANFGGSEVLESVRDAQITPWLTIPSTVTADADARHVDADGNVLEAIAHASATWNSPTAGTLAFNEQWSVGGPGSAQTYAQPGLSYTFTASSKGFISVDYAWNVEADRFAASGWQLLLWRNNRTELVDYTPADYSGNATGNGNLALAFTDGDTYTFELQHYGQIFSPVAVPATLVGQEESFLSWQISAVPELDSGAMVLMGLLVVGAASRRRQVG